VRRASRDGARFAIVDDPPASGASVALAARELRRHGADRRRLVLLLPLLAPHEQVPGRVRDLDAVVLPAARWSVEAELTCAAVRSRMERFLGPGAHVASIERRPLHRREERAHHRTLFRLHVMDGPAGKAAIRDVLVEGVGFGFFAEPAAAVAKALPEYVPHLYGVEDGLVYREWLPEHRRVQAEDGAAEDALADAVVSYALARRGRIPVERDATTYLSGGETVWEAASTTLARAFGRGWPFARRLALDRLVQAALRVDQPSVVDGHTGLSGWFLSATERPVKADPFTPGPLACRDAAFDVAGAAASAPGSPLARRLRRSFERASGHEVEPARWLLYQLVQIEQRMKACPEERRAAARSLSQALEGFFEELFFADLTPSATGPLCALDLDGVLETAVLGFPGLTPSAALAVRALTVHGYRPLIATGRSTGEVEERCRAYKLAGGVAEYGGTAYDARSHTHLALVSESGRADLARLRIALVALGAVEVDPDYHFAVRAWQTPGRRPLDAGVAAAAAAGMAIRVVQGDSQTDFVPAEVDKARALDALVTQLDGQPGPIAAAVGDTVVDLPMLAMAQRRYAPAHAAALRGTPGIEILRRPYQAGLALAAAELLGHQPGGCDACRPPRHSRESALLLTVLTAQERGLPGMLRQAVRLRRESRR
jgi:hydroxymethylpyrimidine pyrophosphatase-like HAD family hydrolase